MAVESKSNRSCTHWLKLFGSSATAGPSEDHGRAYCELAVSVHVGAVQEVEHSSFGFARSSVISNRRSLVSTRHCTTGSISFLLVMHRGIGYAVWACHLIESRLRGVGKPPLDLWDGGAAPLWKRMKLVHTWESQNTCYEKNKAIFLLPPSRKSCFHR